MIIDWEPFERQSMRNNSSWSSKKAVDKSQPQANGNPLWGLSKYRYRHSLP
jgi:hypothetical protein